MEACSICGTTTQGAARAPINNGLYRIECSVCGEYLISSTNKAVLSRNDSSYILSGLSREIVAIGGEPLRLVNEVKKQLSHSLVPNLESVQEKANKLLLRIKENTEYYGQQIMLEFAKDYPLAYAKNSKEFIALIRLLGDANLIKTTFNTSSAHVVLGAEGWGLVNRLKAGQRESLQGFIAISFHDSMASSQQAIKDAISESGYKAMCIDGEYYADRIMDKALGEIRKSRFVVVDLTMARPSVFFEAGFALSLGVESIYVYKKDDSELKGKLEFYVKHYQCISYETPEQLKNVVVNAIAARIGVPKK